MKVSEAIASGRKLRLGTNYTDATLREWLTALDQDIMIQAGQLKDIETISRVAAQEEYDLPAGVTFDMIETITIDGEYVPKLVLSAMQRHGVWMQGGKLHVYPVPTVTDSTTPGIRLQYQDVLEPYAASPDSDLFLKAPYTEAYKFWIASQICLYDRDDLGYNNNIILHNNYMSMYWNKVAQTGAIDSGGIVGLW